MKSRWIKRVMAITLVFGLASTICMAAKNDPKTLTVSEMWEIDSLEPAKDGTFIKEKALVAETLVEANPDFSLKPQLAESWQQINETTWHFNLRPGVLFHNGVPLTAELVAASINRAIEINPAVMKITQIKTIKPVNPLTVEIETFELYPALPAALVYANTSIVHPDSSVNVQGLLTHPIGTGPYKLTKWKQAEQSVFLSKFDRYWGEEPKIENIVYRSIPDPSTRSLEIQKGSVDLIADAPYGDLDILRKKGLEVTIANTARIYALNFGSLIDTPFADRRVRNALSYAINREEIVQYILFGMGKPAGGSYDKSMIFANQDIEPHKFDPNLAKKLLAEAGWSDSDGDGVLDKDNKKLTTTIYTYPQRPGLKPMAMAIQQQWQNIGMATDVRVMDWAAITDSMGPGDVRLAAMATAGIPDPDYFMRRMYGKDGDSNKWGYANQQVDDLLAKGMKTKDPEQRLSIYREAQAVVFEDLPLIPVSYYGVNIVTQPEVGGFVFNPVAHDYMLNIQMYKRP